MYPSTQFFSLVQPRGGLFFRGVRGKRVKKEPESTMANKTRTTARTNTGTIVFTLTKTTSKAHNEVEQRYERKN